MNDEKDFASRERKEETIDILVAPKKKEASPSKSDSVSPKQTEPASPKEKQESSVPSKVKKQESSPSVREKKGEPAADQTRPIRKADYIHEKTGDVAEATRIGSSVSFQPVGPSDAKKQNQKSGNSTEKKRKPGKSAKERRAAAKRRAYEWWDSLRTTVIRSVLYVAFVVSVSAALAYYGISWANDIFALVKEEVSATVTVPENATISEIADLLGEQGIIRYPSVFRMYIGFKNRDTILEFKAGEYEVKSTLNYDQLVGLMKDRKARSIVTITIPEGYTVDEIINLFVSKGMGTREGFVDAINNYPYDYDFIEKMEGINLSPLRHYRLEGYLFPDTYDFYTDSKEIAIIDKMLAAFDYRFESEYYVRLQELGLNVDEMVTLASIIQMEGKLNSDFYTISGVFHNRLRSRDLKKLESDATVQYCLAERKENLSYADLAIDDPYNTYLYEGLPPSAIANPGWEAIMASLYPENNEFYYFVADTDGSTIFAETLPEHLKNVAAVAAAKANGGSVD